MMLLRSALFFPPLSIRAAMRHNVAHEKLPENYRFVGRSDIRRCSNRYCE
jgi:hypothetical protein